MQTNPWFMCDTHPSLASSSVTWKSLTITGAKGKSTVTTREFVKRPMERAPKAASGKGVGVLCGGLNATSCEPMVKPNRSKPNYFHCYASDLTPDGPASGLREKKRVSTILVVGHSFYANNTCSEKTDQVMPVKEKYGGPRRLIF